MNTLQTSKSGGTDIKIRVGQRLRTAAEYVAVSTAYDSEGRKICADIGCDHGYLSIYLIENGICDFVYASDINEKPINTARKNISARDNGCGKLGEKIEILLGDGLSGLEDLGINHVIICGMGGEVISGIIAGARKFHKKGIKFILQPMSSEYELRLWLSENGFVIGDEKLIRDSGRIYTVMVAEYTGEKYVYDSAELMLGKYNIEKGGELLCELCERKLVHAKNLLKQKNVSESDSELYNKLSELYSKLCERTEK